MRTRGFTLIEVAIALALAGILMATAVTSIRAVTDAAVRSGAVELTGAVKMSYDRAIMLRRTQRIGIDIDKGLWWIEFTEDPFAVGAERMSGTKGASGSDEEGSEELRDIEREFDEDDDTQVKAAILGGIATRFAMDGDLDAGKPTPLPSGVCFSRVWTDHQEEAFNTGIAYLYFWRGGFTESALIELVDSHCEDKGDIDEQDAEYVTLEVLPLTGRVKTRHEKLEVPDLYEPDSRTEGDI